ncbi:E3 ubiquitin-protein ligase PRT1-like isoform X2 [Oryza brachyantha]|uniref:E3 ubiquitin-protein ligase PRT1-like isoform X2 n=1 Tax=Oryza brachyantha TaxID=4533 RepID=UPI0003EAAFE8|nr:E3 ubiquitin-protein ligase PRT1-like isoform X2 [Oryza brachyantha]
MAGKEEEDPMVGKEDHVSIFIDGVMPGTGSDQGAWLLDRWFCCPICLEPAYKPVVLVCGHMICLNCCSESMSIVESSRCCICKANHDHLPRQCGVIGQLISKLSHAEKSVKVSLEDVLCIFCKELLLEPCVLNCGHVYCLTCLPYVDEKEIKCQACGAPHPAKLTVCWNLDYFLKHYFFEEYNLRQQRVSYSVPEKKTGPSKVQSSRLKHTHVGVGCDDCGVFPIQGRRYSCTECEAPGFDLCDKCFQKGTSTVGRFYQNHTAEHTMQLDDSFLFPKLLSYLDEKRRGEQHQDGSEEEDVVWVHEDEVGVVWDDE